MSHAIRELHSIRMMAERMPAYASTDMIGRLLGSWIDRYVKEFHVRQFTHATELVRVGDDEDYRAAQERYLASKLGPGLLKVAERRVDIEPDGENLTLKFYVIDCSPEVRA